MLSTSDNIKSTYELKCGKKLIKLQSINTSRAANTLIQTNCWPSVLVIKERRRMERKYSQHKPSRQRRMRDSLVDATTCARSWSILSTRSSSRFSIKSTLVCACVAIVSACSARYIAAPSSPSAFNTSSRCCSTSEVLNSSTVLRRSNSLASTDGSVVIRSPPKKALPSRGDKEEEDRGVVPKELEVWRRTLAHV